MGTLHNAERGGALCNPSAMNPGNGRSILKDRRGRLASLLNNAPRNEAIHAILLANAMAVSEVHRRIQSQYALNRCVGTLKTRLPVCMTGREPREQLQVAPG